MLKMRGFTIVELLIVIVVIGILAAITIVAFNGVQGRAHDASVRSDLAALAKQFEDQRISSADNFYPTTNSPGFVVRVNQSAYQTDGLRYNLLLCFPSTSAANEIMILATSKSGKKFYLEGGSVREYTTTVDWSNTDATVVCRTVKSGWVGSGAGYRSDQTPQWRTWAGGA